MKKDLNIIPMKTYKNYLSASKQIKKLEKLKRKQTMNKYQNRTMVVKRRGCLQLDSSEDE